MYKQRDILIIPVPFTDLTTDKKRPVVVLSNDYYNNKTEDIVVIAITSNIEQREYSILISSRDIEEDVLPQQSMIGWIKSTRLASPSWLRNSVF